MSQSSDPAPMFCFVFVCQTGYRKLVSCKGCLSDAIAPGDLPMTTDVLPSPSAAIEAAKAIRACPFDLVARAELAIQGCTRLTNPQRGGQPYSYVELHTDPPIALHSPWDYADVTGRLLDALTLARIMTGQSPNE